MGVWDILENVLKGHPVLLNRAPTLHRLGIQAFQPKLIEGKAIQLHPLVCTAFNADFDGDQMAVHLPLGPEAILEAQLLMLASHNILNPANGSPVTVPSQDMVLGLYYMTKLRKSDKDYTVKGEGLTFYSPEEVTIAYNEKKVDLNAGIKVRTQDFNEEGELTTQIIETTVGRVLFNEKVPAAAGYINEVLTKKSLRDIIHGILKKTSVPETAAFLDEIKTQGYKFAFQGGLSFSLGDIIIPAEKQGMIDKANTLVDGIMGNYNMGLITNNERYNQVIDIWTSTNAELTELSMKRIREDQQGFNSVFMMLDSGARGSKEQIRQLTGMRGLMAKPKKSNAGGGEIIENPILSNFKEGLSILEYFISTHGARKGLADTALKTADAGYLTRRLVDVSQDVIIYSEARNPSNPAVVSEIDGVVSFGKIKRGNREIIIESKLGEIKKYLVKLSNQILVQENDYVKAGMPLSDGSITPNDILNIKGPSAVQKYLVNEVQEVYRLQGVKINDKHFEVVVRQMMRKVRIIDSGDTIFLEDQLAHKADFIEENDKIFGMKVVEDAGDSENLKPGQILTARELRDENSILRREDKALVTARDANPATATPILQGITRASLQTKSFISAASFQETTKVLNEAAVNAKVDDLEGLKENVIVGHRIPAGTGVRKFDNIIVGSKEEFNEMMKAKEEMNYN